MFFNLFQDGCTGKKHVTEWNKLVTSWWWDNLW